MPSFMCCVSAVCTFENNVEAMACGICDSPNEAAGDDDNDDGDDFGGDFGGGYGEGGDLGDDGNESCEGVDAALLLKARALRLREAAAAEAVLPSGLPTTAAAFAAVYWEPSLALDEALVAAVNEVCDEEGVDPGHLSASALEAALAAPTRADSALGRADRKGVLGRLGFLLALNARVLAALPLVDLDLRARFGDKEVVRTAAKGNNLPAPSSVLGQWVFDRRALLFKRTKLSFWRDVVRATEKFVAPPLDEYEKNTDLRKFKVNRIAANPLLLRDQPDAALRLKASLFGQMQREMASRPDSEWRKGFVDIQDAGQKRAFYVDFAGEGVDDHGGPYRAVFQAAVVEEPPLLGLVRPCPNAGDSKSMNRDKLLLDPRGGSLADFTFLGKLVGLAVRHGINVPLNFPDLVWKPLVGTAVDRRDLSVVDKGATDAMSMVEALRPAHFDDGGVADILDGLEEALGAAALAKPGGGTEPLTFENRLAFVAQAEEAKLAHMETPLGALFLGLAAALPVSLLPIFTPRELETLICGAPTIDVGLLKRVTEYEGEGVHADAPHVKHFWAALEQMDQAQRSKFVNFVSARSRLPGSVDEFPMNFKVAEPNPAAKERPDSHLPHSQTCFFTLKLPFYSSQEVCFRKLLYAIDNATTMDDDYHNRETWGS